MESNCLWLVYSSYHLLNLSFLVRQSKLRGQHCTRAVLHHFLKVKVSQNVHIYLYLPNFPITNEIPW